MWSNSFFSRQSSLKGNCPAHLYISRYIRRNRVHKENGKANTLSREEGVAFPSWRFPLYVGELESGETACECGSNFAVTTTHVEWTALPRLGQIKAKRARNTCPIVAGLSMLSLPVCSESLRGTSLWLSGLSKAAWCFRLDDPVTKKKKK